MTYFTTNPYTLKQEILSFFKKFQALPKLDKKFTADMT